MNRLNWDGVRSRIYDQGFRKEETWAKGLWVRGMERGLGGVMRFGMLCLYYIYVHNNNNNNNTVYILVKERQDLRLGNGEREKWKRVLAHTLVKTANHVKLKRCQIFTVTAVFFFHCCNFLLFFWRKGVIILCTF